MQGWADAIWDVGIAFGTVGRARAASARDHHLPRRGVRPGRRKPVVAYGDSLADDLRRRDFTVNAMAVALPGTSSSTRTAA